MISEANAFSVAMVQAVIDYIEANLLQELTIAKIAAHFFVSVSSLALSFKMVCGMTVTEYIRNRRLSLAGEELMTSGVSIINLAFQYGYETPEAFTKAFSRFHGFPPSFVRRTLPALRAFHPIRVEVSLQGGWNAPAMQTKPDCSGQEVFRPGVYHGSDNAKGGTTMKMHEPRYRVDVSAMKHQREWRVLCSLAQALQQRQIAFKVDGKTLIFAHGLEFPLDKICLTFKWHEEGTVRDFFRCGAAKSSGDGFKYVDAVYGGMKIRCMFYGGCADADTDEFLYRNTDWVRINQLPVAVQSLEFYLENAEADTALYRSVRDWMSQSCL